MKNKHTLLIIGFVWPEPKSSAAGGRMLQIIDLFLDYGYAITFASTAQNLEFSEDVTIKGVGRKTIALNCSSFDAFILELQPTVVLFDRFMVEEQFGWRVSEHCPDALKVLDTEDLHFLRQARQDAVKNNRGFEETDLYSDVAKREVSSILRCDVTLVVSEFEMELLKRRFSISKDLLFYLPIFGSRNDLIAGYETRSDFVFIGNFLHEPNWDCVQYLSKVIWPLIHKQLPKQKLFIYGAYPTQKVFELHKPGTNFIVKGRAEEANVVLSDAKVLLAPVRFGAGLKGKLIEAMECGTPSVTSTVGAEGIAGGLVWNGFVEDDAVAFATAAVKVYGDEVVWDSCQVNGFRIVAERFSRGGFYEDFEERIAFVLRNLKEHRNGNFIGLILMHNLVNSSKYMSKWIEEKNSR